MRFQRLPAPMLLGLLVAGAPAAKAAPNPATNAVQDTRSEIVAPLEVTKTKHLAVQVKINGEGPFRLILDTGAPLSFVSGRLATKVGLLKAEQASRPAFFGMRGQSVLKSVDIGGAQVKDLSVMILDHPIVQALNEVDAPLDGIIGFSFFARYRTTLDYQAGKVSFMPVDYVPQDVLTGIMARLSNPGSSNIRNIAPVALWGFSVEKRDEEDGVRVTQVYPKSPAEAAGMKVGDRLLTLDGRWTENGTDTWEAAATVKPGQTVALSVRRDGQVQELSITPRLGL